MKVIFLFLDLLVVIGAWLFGFVINWKGEGGGNLPRLSPAVEVFFVVAGFAVWFGPLLFQGYLLAILFFKDRVFISPFWHYAAPLAVSGASVLAMLSLNATHSRVRQEASRVSERIERTQTDELRKAGSVANSCYLVNFDQAATPKDMTNCRALLERQVSDADVWQQLNYFIDPSQSGGSLRERTSQSQGARLTCGEAEEAWFVEFFFAHWLKKTASLKPHDARAGLLALLNPYILHEDTKKRLSAKILPGLMQRLHDEASWSSHAFEPSSEDGRLGDDEQTNKLLSAYLKNIGGD
jgi:hypothetical protein